MLDGRSGSGSGPPAILAAGASSLPVNYGISLPPAVLATQAQLFDNVPVGGASMTFERNAEIYGGGRDRRLRLQGLERIGPCIQG